MKKISEEDNLKNLVQKNMPLVKSIVSKMMIDNNLCLDREDYISYGTIGLIDAINKFDKKKDTCFSTYATIRIKGAIIDGIRSNSPISRTTSNKISLYNSAADRLRDELKREPTIKELANSLSMSIEKVSEIQNYCTFISQISLEGLLEKSSYDKQLHTVDKVLEDKSKISIVDRIVQSEATCMLKKCIEKLREKDKIILSLYYYENLNFKEIGDILNVSESRVSQLHKKAISELKTLLYQHRYIDGAQM